MFAAKVEAWQTSTEMHACRSKRCKRKTENKEYTIFLSADYRTVVTSDMMITSFYESRGVNTA